MTTLWQDSIIAMLASIGLVCILWLIAGAICRPFRQRCSLNATILLPVQGDAVQAEFALRKLLQQRREEGAFRRICFVDCGLSPIGRKSILLLCGQDTEIYCVLPNELQDKLTEK